MPSRHRKLQWRDVQSVTNIKKGTINKENVKHFSFTLRIVTPVKYVVLSIKVVMMLDGVGIWQAI